jgi:hypothetical protein
MVASTIHFAFTLGRRMNFDKRSFGIALLWLAILALAIVWLYGVVHRHDLAGVTTSRLISS